MEPPRQQGVVTQSYQRQYEDPISVKAGEAVRITERDLWGNDERYPWIWCINSAGKGGWTPEQYIEVTGETGIAKQAYSALELTVATGDVVTIEREANGWYWVINQAGNEGWVPITHILLQ